MIGAWIARREEFPVTRKVLVVLIVVAAAAMLLAGVQQAFAAGPAGRKYEPVLNPKDFVRVIDNRYFPLPVGRTLVYRGIKDGKSRSTGST